MKPELVDWGKVACHLARALEFYESPFPPGHDSNSADCMCIKCTHRRAALNHYHHAVTKEEIKGRYDLKRLPESLKRLIETAQKLQTRYRLVCAHYTPKSRPDLDIDLDKDIKAVVTEYTLETSPNVDTSRAWEVSLEEISAAEAAAQLRLVPKYKDEFEILTGSGIQPVIGTTEIAPISLFSNCRYAIRRIDNRES